MSRTPGDYIAKGRHVYTEHGATIGMFTARGHLDTEKYDAEAVANAKLFAAAPKLLEFLKDAITVYPKMEWYALIRDLDPSVKSVKAIEFDESEGPHAC